MCNLKANPWEIWIGDRRFLTFIFKWERLNVVDRPTLAPATSDWPWYTTTNWPQVVPQKNKKKQTKQTKQKHIGAKISKIFRPSTPPWEIICVNPRFLGSISHVAYTSHITLTSKWLRWRLKSPVSRLFTQPFIRAQIKENIKAPRHWPLCGEFTGTGEFPAQRASYAENVSIWWRHHESWVSDEMRFCIVFLTVFDAFRIVEPSLDEVETPLDKVKSHNWSKMVYPLLTCDQW